MGSQIKKFMMGLVVIAIAVVFVVQFQPGGGQTVDTGPDCAAEVRGNCIPANHFKAAQRLVAPFGADPESLRHMNLPQRVMDGLVERFVLLEDAKRLGITLSDEEITAELAKGRAYISLPVRHAIEVGYPLRLQGGQIRYIRVTDPATDKFDVARYEKEVRRLTSMSPPDFRDFQRDEILASRMRDLIRSQVKVGTAEAQAQFNRERSTISANYARFDRNFFMDYAVDLSAEAQAAWGQKNGKDLVDPVWEGRKPAFEVECRVASHIFVRIDPFDPTGGSPEDKKAAATTKLEAAKKRIADGESFADVAKELSEDLVTKRRGGRMGCVPRSQVPQAQPLEEKLFSMAVGDISEPVMTDQGGYIIKLEKIAKGKDAEAEGLKDTFLELFLKHEGERLAAEAAKKVLDQVRGGKSMADAITAHLAELAPELPADAEGKPSAETTLPFKQTDNPIPGVTGANVADALFALKKNGEVPKDVFQTQTGYVVAQLKEKADATPEDWEKEKAFYITAMRVNKQQEALELYIKRLMGKVTGEIKITPGFIQSPTPDLSASAPLPLP